jgi:hypothetical protein
VPGTSIYSYISHSLVEFLGRDWLERGSMEVRFVHPLYEGEEARITGRLSGIGEDAALAIDLQIMNPQGAICAVGAALLSTRPPAPEPAIGDYPAGTRSRSLPISPESLHTGQLLVPVKSEFTWNIHWEYCQKTIRDHHPIYRQILHPGWLLLQANRILVENCDLRLWIHAASMIQKYHAQAEECMVETRGRVKEKFERKGHRYLVLDLALFAGLRCLETIRHTIIFRIAHRAA